MAETVPGNLHVREALQVIPDVGYILATRDQSGTSPALTCMHIATSLVERRLRFSGRGRGGLPGGATLPGWDPL